MLEHQEKRRIFGALTMKGKMSSGAPKKPGGQGTGHLKQSSVNAFSSAPASKPNKATGPKSAR
jgi:hypothetical protein